MSGFEGADCPSYELSQLLEFYERVADDPAAKDMRLPGERALQKALALTLMQSVIGGDLGTEETHFVTAFIKALYTAGTRRGRTADEVLRATGLSGPPVDSDKLELVLDIKNDMLSNQAFTGVSEEQARKEALNRHAGQLFDGASGRGVEEARHEIRRFMKRGDKARKEDERE